MAYEQRELNGSLFKNNDKKTDTHPDYTGSALINGVSYWLSSWINTSATGVKFMPIKFKAKDSQASTQEGGGKTDDLNDSIPF